MKKSTFLIVTLILVTISSTFAQMSNPVSWRFESKKSGDNEYSLIFYADIDSNWHLYSQDIDDGGPIPTTFTFIPSENYKLIGNVAESEENRETLQDEIFEMKLTKFHDRAVFTQKIKVFNTNKPIKGNIRFMSCSENRCNPPVTQDFSFSL